MPKQTLTKEILKALSEHFPEDAIGWKPQRLYPRDNPTKALMVPHITSRHVMDRLDLVVGPAGWQQDFEFLPGVKAVRLMLTVLGITKCDIGFVAGDDDAAIKGSVSDGLKRAAVLFGIGRYLYSAEKQWVDWDAKKKKPTEDPRLIVKNGPKPEKAKKARKVVAPEGEPPRESDRPKTELAGDQVTIGLIQEEANAQLEAIGYKPHYDSRVGTIKAMEACGYDKGTAKKYLSENFVDIVACLVDRVEEKEKRE